MIYKFDTPLKLFGQTIFTLNGLIQYATYYSNTLQKLYGTIDFEVNKRVNIILNEGQARKIANQKSENYWKKKYLKLKNRAYVDYDVYNSPNGVKVLIPKSIYSSPKEEVEQLLYRIKVTLEAAYFNKIWSKETVESEYDEKDRKIDNPYKLFVKDQHTRNRELFKKRKRS